MEKAKRYIEASRKYIELMRRSDAENRILALNYSMEDKVYNSLPDGDRLKEAMRTRKLNGMTPEEFIEGYKAQRDKIWTINILSEQPVALARLVREVPAKIDAAIVAKSGHKEKYLLKLCKENGWGLEELRTALVLSDRYKSDLNTIAKLTKKGWNLDDVEVLMSVKEAYTRRTDAATLQTLGELAKQFCGGDSLDSDELEALVQKIDERLETGNIKWKNGKRRGLYLGTAIANCVRLAREKEILSLDAVLDYFTLELSRSPEAILSRGDGSIGEDIEFFTHPGADDE